MMDKYNDRIILHNAGHTPWKEAKEWDISMYQAQQPLVRKANRRIYIRWENSCGWLDDKVSLI